MAVFDICHHIGAGSVLFVSELLSHHPLHLKSKLAPVIARSSRALQRRNHPIANAICEPPLTPEC